jgi:DNA polymerase-3 subunit epsilon
MSHELEAAVILRDIAHGLGWSGPIAALDLETTGLNVEMDRIVQVAIVRVVPERDGDVAFEHEHFKSLVSPDIPVPPSATAVHGIADSDLVDAPTFASMAEVIYAFLNGCIPVGFNLRGFDLRMLASEFRRVGHPAPLLLPAIDVQTIYHRRQPRDLEAAVRHYLGVPHVDAHDAMGDVVASVRVLAQMFEQYPDLPRTPGALADYCARREPNWVDDDGKIVWRDGAARLAVGKLSGVPLQVAAKKHVDFLRWMLRADFPQRTKDIISAALRGEFPANPTEGGEHAHRRDE